MEVLLTADDEKLYSKLYVSISDVEFARYCACVLLKKGWHSQPWERRGTIYQQQAAFTSALVTAYGRPFTNSKGWPKIPEELIRYNEQETKLHKNLITLRHTVYAHSDSENYSIRPWRSGDFSTDIVGAPTLRITSEDAQLFQVMTRRLIDGFRRKMELLLA
jgi:hypothetical protein